MADTLCRHCGQRVVLVHYSHGDQWMHQSAGAAFQDGMHMYCYITRAEPKETSTQAAMDARASAERWLAAHDAEVRAKALREAAKAGISFSRGAAIAMHHQCHKRQCKCGNPGSEEFFQEVCAEWVDALRTEARRIEVDARAERGER